MRNPVNTHSGWLHGIKLYPFIPTKLIRRSDLHYAALSAHINAEMRKRCDKVENLLRALSFLTDRALIQNVHLGKVPTHLTAADITLNRQLRDAGPHQKVVLGRRVRQSTS